MTSQQLGHDFSGNDNTPAQQMSLAERILTIPVRHEDVTRPAQLLEAVRLDLARELQAEVLVHWLERQEELDEQVGAGAAQSLLSSSTFEASSSPVSFELRARGLVVAHLVISRSAPLAAEEHRLVGFLVRDLSHWLTEASKRTETRLVTALSTTLPTCESLDEAAKVAVFTIVERLGAEAGMLLVRDESGFRRLVAMGPWADDEASERERHDVAAACARTYGPRISSGRIVAAPVGNLIPARYVLLLQMPQVGTSQLHGFPTLMQAARVLEPHLSARWRALVLAELLQLGYASLGVPTDTMYGAALRTAVRLVPGADSGSLLVRHEANEPFVIQAVHGHVSADLVGRTVTDVALRGWYGPEDHGWHNGFAKVINFDDRPTNVLHLTSAELGDAGHQNPPEHEAELESAVGHDKANLCLPVVFDGTVLALLCLKNRAESNAFGRDSREIAEMFGSPLANMLQRNRTHALLVHAALTDSLTGLLNRRAFDSTLERELARTARSGAALNILLMDMSNFKAINDAFGHDAGDEALIAVAHALRATVRDGDYLFRWGGDEFAAILVDEEDHLTGNAVERLRSAVAAVEIRGQRLSIDVGWAEAPSEGNDSNTLLRVADERMYANKRSS